MASPLPDDMQKEFDAILQSTGGRLTPDDLLTEIQKQPGSRLYRYVFDCSDRRAALRYRLVRCKEILRRASITYTLKGDPEPHERRRVVSVVNATGPVYLRTEDAVRTKKYRIQLEKECRDELDEWVRRWTGILGPNFVKSVVSGRKW